MAGECAWQGAAYMAGVRMAGCVCGKGCAWQGACIAGGMHSRGMHGRGAYMTGGMHRGKTAAEACGTHPTGMHSS